MQNPFWVADARVEALWSLAGGNHTCALNMEEGRKWPAHACIRDTSHIEPLTRPKSAKSASLQGEALALVKFAQVQSKNSTERHENGASS